ncbi:hypothetical protein WJX72_000296 [[Myrmecia] bisecta]|uniref:Nitronate monooxygenase domain-containing protein n=1 Tax=[Myrmecia] bisecta TaxID=41462 RepID=A0AAW1QDZ4_9CHLO
MIHRSFARQAATECQPRASWLSFGSFEGLVEPVKAAGIRLIAQVQTLEAVSAAIRFGADAIVVQGHESGGHGASAASTFTFVPEAADVCRAVCEELGIPRVPIVAAGRVTDGRQIAAAFMLGADGVVMGTRLTATPEATYREATRAALLAAPSEAAASPGTLRTRLYDVLSPHAWPEVRSADTSTEHGGQPLTCF